MKKIICLLFIAVTVHGLSAQSYLKINGAYAALGIINPAIEVGIAPHVSIQADMVASFWQSYIKGAPLVMSIGFLEGRWYPKERFNGFFAAPCVGYGVYKMRRFDYWSSPYLQYGSSVFLGANIGYVWQVNRWSFELFLGGGWQHAIYEGYNTETGERYDYGEYPGKYNKSAEWIPFKGGLMIGVRI
ncbi:MAG: DUF3575 domain-containing protein [Prevotellaceae bacterium]|jgi:hypothetical protein|nr:DUF3575 domain-containing protein [Prevotellaceae bacterium]